MARNVRPAAAASDHGGSVRFAGGGFIPSRRWPRPSPLIPWQITQLAAKMTLPACLASRDASNPAGALGAPPSHPEMASEIVNRTIRACTLLFTNHCIAKGFHLIDNCRNKLLNLPVNRLRSNHR